MGQLAIAGFLLALFSGIALALPYDIGAPYESLQIIHLTNRGGFFFRALHYWTGQLFLIFTFFHAWEHLEAGTERRLGRGVWIRLALSTPLIFVLMVFGFILKADSEGILARRIFGGLMQTIPIVGAMAEFALAGAEGDYQILYLHHAVTATVAIFIVMIEHARRLWAGTVPLILVLSSASILSLYVPPRLHNDTDPIIKGPWYFLGLQEILHWMTYPIIVLSLLFSLIVMFTVLPFVTIRMTQLCKRALAVVCILYGLLILFAWFFRGENWQYAPPSLFLSTDYRANG